MRRKVVRAARAVLLALACACIGMAALAHDIRPVVVIIAEQLPGVFQARVEAPADLLPPGGAPSLVWPASCVQAEADGALAGVMRCDGSLAGQDLALRYPGANPALATFFRLTRRDGSVTSAMLPPDADAWTVPAAPGTADIAVDYLLLGIEHIIGGLDHLLFVLGLLVIARTPGRILLTVTGFTLAHSLTLSLSSLGLLGIPIVPVEAAIALSILFLAHEISRHDTGSLTYRYPLIVSFGFGLLHGLGFASALGEIGLAPGQVFVSLLFFNLGVETGQVLFIVAVMAVSSGFRRMFARGAGGAPAPFAGRRADLAAAYVIGVPSAFWLIERVAQFVP